MITLNSNFKEQLSSTPCPPPSPPLRYIENPLLVKGRKFDIRSYMLVIAARPFVVLYHPGYLRLTCGAYDSSSSNLAVHLTNQFVQKQQEEYAAMREDTVRWGLLQGT